MTSTYVIVNMAYRFARQKGRGFAWVFEYPDATEWNSEAAAMQALRRIGSQGHCANIFSLIENYGLESQRTIGYWDALEQEMRKA